MALNLRNRSLLTVQDYTQREFKYLLDLARDLKRAKYARTEQEHLKGKEICLIFEKTSTRTRCAFEVACHDQGANVTYLDPAGSQIGHKESFKDTARVLGRMFDAIEYRGASQSGVETLAKYAGVPVFNGLTDEYHPTQMLADVMTMREFSDKPVTQIKYAFLGDTRNNMGHSLMIVGCLMGMDVRICGPKQLWPSDEYVKIARELEVTYGAKLTITDDPKEAVSGVDFIHTDVWVSMGEPAAVWKERIALLRRGEAMTAENQRRNVRIAAQSLAPVAREHDLVVGHGNGPQVGLLALQGAAYGKVETYPLDVLGAQTEGMIGYIIEQELGNLLPFERPFATLLTMIEVDAKDPAFSNPTKFIGPQYGKEDADRLAAEKSWVFKMDGDKWRRVVASPEPKRIFELRPIKWLLDQHTIVIAAGGGGIPAVYDGDRKLHGIECVIDKDLATELLARDLDADLLVMLTDADAVYTDWGKPTQRAIRRATPDSLAQFTFAAGSMGPKVDAACRFVRATGRKAAIGALDDLQRIIAGEAGTTLQAEGGIEYVASK
jgi:carbamate kinase/ornithine carbamoyltransferase